ncbi:hypothetical protein [Burkholderia ubonensis]|uniref:hypothetical protein n=1 Tax=Burkholderia ubonensis TaxID=101571 RepID=UPI000A5FB639|nr:hypothetical protein [Burkholderia ubonensis]
MKINERLTRTLYPHENYRANVFTIKNAVDKHIVRDRKTPHFLTYHFEMETLFAIQFIDFICILERIRPRTGVNLIKKIGEIRGDEISKYEQIIQALSEIVIAKQFIEAFPPENGFVFEWEPTDKTKKNPEFMVSCSEWRVLVEVKSPSLSDYRTKNRRASAQVVGRTPHMKDVIENLYGKEHVALPLDNKMKDFLVSAEAKFSSFTSIGVPTYGLLFVCWSQRMFEAITPVTSLGSGLFTEHSFYRNDGIAIKFPNVSGVIVTAHQHLLGLLLKEWALPPGIDGFGYGNYWTYGSPANPTLCDNPAALMPVPMFLQKVLHTVPAGQSLDPLSQELDFVHWLG